MSDKFNTDTMPWLFTPHSEGELDEYFSADHTKTVAATSKEIIAGLSESRDRLSGEVCYKFNYNQRRYKLTLLRFADVIVRADVTIKKIKSAIMKAEMENRELRKQIRELERKMNNDSAAV